MQKTWVPSLGWEDPLEKGMATHSSILAWRISMAEEPGGLQFMGLQRVGHDWATNTHTCNVYTWVRKWWTVNPHYLQILYLHMHLLQFTCNPASVLYGTSADINRAVRNLSSVILSFPDEVQQGDALRLCQLSYRDDQRVETVLGRPHRARTSGSGTSGTGFKSQFWYLLLGQAQQSLDTSEPCFLSCKTKKNNLFLGWVVSRISDIKSVWDICVYFP